MKNKKTKKRVTREASRKTANKALRSSIALARTDGGLTMIAEELTRISAQMGCHHDRYGRQEVFAWLHPDKEKRVEPRLGVGLMIIEAQKRIRKCLYIPGA